MVAANQRFLQEVDHDSFCTHCLSFFHSQLCDLHADNHHPGRGELIQLVREDDRVLVRVDGGLPPHVLAGVQVVVLGDNDMVQVIRSDQPFGGLVDGFGICLADGCQTVIGDGFVSCSVRCQARVNGWIRICGDLRLISAHKRTSASTNYGQGVGAAATGTFVPNPQNFNAGFVGQVRPGGDFRSNQQEVVSGMGQISMQSDNIASSSGGYVPGGYVQNQNVGLPVKPNSFGHQNLSQLNQLHAQKVSGSVAKVPAGVCYRCGLPGHGIKECKAVLFCDVRGKETHVSDKCLLPNQAKPVAALIGCGADGLQMFTAMTGKKVETDKSKHAIALVSMHSGNIEVQQLVDAFSRMFQWGWEWKAKPYMRNSFLVKFPSAQKIEEMKGYEYIGLPGLNASVKVSRWSNASMAKFKLYTVWVRMTGIPESLMHYHGFCEAASMIGKVKEIDMKYYRKTDIVRAKVGVKDTRKIPAFSELNEEDYIYDIWYELEDMVEQGGPMLGGSLVVNSVQTSDLSQGGGKAKEQKRQRDATAVGESEGQKSTKNGANDKSDEGSEVVSSQYELEKELMEKMAKKKETQKDSDGVFAGILSERNNIADAEMSEEQDSYDDELSEDPDDFARKVGLSTLKINEINREIAVEEEKENAVPRKVASNQCDDGFVGCSAMEDPVLVEEQARTEALDRIKKAKQKAEVDEAVRRRSARNVKSDDVHSMDKVEEMAKKKNLEGPAGSPAIPGEPHGHSSWS
ncbi:hypothetical protein ACQ4PT_012051 [Festuca glaucescens]